jgi:hypothetical protein
MPLKSFQVSAKLWNSQCYYRKANERNYRK